MPTKSTILAILCLILIFPAGLCAEEMNTDMEGDLAKANKKITIGGALVGVGSATFVGGMTYMIIRSTKKNTSIKYGIETYIVGGTLAAAGMAAGIVGGVILSKGLRLKKEITQSVNYSFFPEIDPFTKTYALNLSLNF